MPTVSPATCDPAPPLAGFARRDGASIYDDAGPLRFLSVNVPNLHVVEDGGWHLPTEWEQRDALCTVRQLGGQVARTYVISVGDSGVELPRHVTAPGVLEEELMVSLDQALALANEQGVRLIIPLVDQWSWWGGIAEYAAFRGQDADAFWTDPQLITDFEATVDAVVGRVNTVTGVAYADDPAIFGWETGNELDAPTDWTLRIAARIKALDGNHLVIDGHYGVDDAVLDAAVLEEPVVDIVSDHFYWPAPWWDDYPAALAADVATVAGRLPLLLGEFGLLPADQMIDTLQAAADEEDVVGAMIWSLRFHADDGGFYWHSEGFVGDVEHRSFRWPGFPSGAAYGEASVLTALRELAFEVQGQEPPVLDAPDAPTILAVDVAGTVSWQGVVGAQSYVLERADHEAGPWTVVAEGFDDAEVAQEAIVVDPKGSGTAWYRMSAVGEGGSSTASATWGPVERVVEWIDPLADLSLAVRADAGLTIDGSNSGSFDGDTGRLTRSTASEQSVDWSPGGLIAEVQVVTYAWPSQAVPTVGLSVSADGKTWTELSPTEDNQGGDWQRVVLTAGDVPADSSWLRLTLFEVGGQIWNPQVAELRLVMR